MSANIVIIADVAILYKGNDKIMNNSYVKLSEIEWDFLNCAMSSNERAIENPEGKWYYPSGNPISCTSDMEPFNCKLTEDKLGVQLYRNPNLRSKNSLKKVFDPGEYACCLPQKCDDGRSIRATLRIWGLF